MPEYYPYDFAALLVDPESIKIFLSEALQPEDASYFSAALAIVARSEGIAELAIKTNLSRDEILIALERPDNLRLSTTHLVLQAIGLSLPLSLQPSDVS